MSYKEKCIHCEFESPDHKPETPDSMFYPFYLECINCGKFFPRKGPKIYAEYRKVIGLLRTAAGNGTLLTWSDLASLWMEKAIKEILKNELK